MACRSCLAFRHAPAPARAFLACCGLPACLNSVVGLFTRPVAFLLSGQMAVAYFMSHAPRAFFPVLNGGDAAALYCFVFLYLAFAGPGPWSMDAYLRRGDRLST